MSDGVDAERRSVSRSLALPPSVEADPELPDASTRRSFGDPAAFVSYLLVAEAAPSILLQMPRGPDELRIREVKHSCVHGSGFKRLFFGLDLLLEEVDALVSLYD